VKDVEKEKEKKKESMGDGARADEEEDDELVFGGGMAWAHGGLPFVG
jgi:hypothetical protein